MDENNEFEDEDGLRYVLRVLWKVVETSANESAVEEAQEVIDRISN
jgi:hypothetical protein